MPKAVSIALTLVIAVASTAAQSGRRLPRTSQDKDQVLTLRSDEVLLNVTVTNEYGRLVTDLRKQDFIITEDGQRQEIAGFQISTVPVNVALMLDASGSVINELSFLKSAAEKFVDQLGPDDRVSAIEFHAKVELIQDWTASRDDLRHAISWRFRPGEIPKQGGNTSLYDALYVTADEQLKKVEGRRAIIVLTDCLDTSSKVTYQQGLDAVIKSGAIVYVVSKARSLINRLQGYRGGVGRILSPGNAQQAAVIIAQLERAEELMVDMCRKTGGQLFSPMEDSDMASVYGQVANELKNQYVITYHPKNEARDGSLRRVSVFLSQPGYKARTRNSYYAPKD